MHYYQCLNGAIVRISFNSIIHREGFGFSYFDMTKKLLCLHRLANNIY